MSKKVSMLDELRPKTKETVKGPTSVRFTPEEYAEISETARRLGVTISDLIRWRNAYAVDAKIEVYVEPTPKNKLRMP